MDINKLKQLRKDLQDAPKEIKDAFNQVINYFQSSSHGYTYSDPIIITDVNLAFDSKKNEECLIDLPKDAANFVSKYEPKYCYTPAFDSYVGEDIIPNQKSVYLYKIKGPNNKEALVKIKSARYEGEGVLILSVDPIFGGGDVVLTSKLHDSLKHGKFKPKRKIV